MHKLKAFRFEQFVVLSLFLHVLVYLAWSMQHSDEPVVAKRVDSLTISVGLQAALAGAQLATPSMLAQAQTPPAEQALEMVEDPTTEAPLDQPEQEHLIEEEVPLTVPALVEPAKPVAQAQPIKPPQAKPLPKQDPPKPKPEPPRQTQPKPKPKALEPPAQAAQQPRPQLSAQQQGAQGINGAKVNQQLQQDTGQGKESGGVLSEQQYAYLIHQHLLKHKTAPKMLKSKRRRGVVKVKFTIDRQGKLLNYQLVQPSRIREFDRAAIKLGREANPFPAAPESVSWQQRSFTVDVIYELK